MQAPLIDMRQMVARAELRAIAEVFQNCDRLGAEVDEPEGERYIQISSTFALELSRMIRAAAALLCLALPLFVSAQIGGPARRARVDIDQQEYVVTWWPLLCGSQQANDCEGNRPKTRVANVLVERGSERIGKFTRRDCISDGCVKEDADAWARAALEGK
jgi:hypothetical protein